MKRSELNKVLKDLETMGREYKFSLPPFCHMTPEEWQSAGHEYNVDGAERLMFGTPQGLTPEWLALEENKKVIQQLFYSVPQPVELLPGPLDDQRGIGVSEMADAIMHGRRPAACGERAAHVVEIIEGFRKSSDSGQVYTLQSTF